MSLLTLLESIVTVLLLSSIHQFFDLSCLLLDELDLLQGVLGLLAMLYVPCFDSLHICKKSSPDIKSLGHRKISLIQ